MSFLSEVLGLPYLPEFRHAFSSLNRILSNGTRALTTTRNISFKSGTIGGHTKAVLNLMLNTTENALKQPSVVHSLHLVNKKDSSLNSPGVATYLGTILGIISSYLFQDKRERRMMNVAEVIAMTNADHHFSTNTSTTFTGEEGMKSIDTTVVGMFEAIKFVMGNALQFTFGKLIQKRCLIPYIFMSKIVNTASLQMIKLVTDGV